MPARQAAMMRDGAKELEVAEADMTNDKQDNLGFAECVLKVTPLQLTRWARLTTGQRRRAG